MDSSQPYFIIAHKLELYAKENAILRKQLEDYGRENEIARAEEEKVREMSRREQEAEKKVKMMEDILKRVEKDMETLKEENKKLQRELDNVKAAASERFRGLELQVSNLEREAEKFSLFFKSGLHPNCLPPLPYVIDIDDDDGDNELDLLSNGLKRKLSSSEIPNEGENDGNNSDDNMSKQLKDSSYMSVNNLPPLRQFENKS
ncbi:hypothetical protein Cgig2_031520 [Carnegiea gigantea]|uniref:Uncharacterized protein n=1 Tax=Carnegiea gigantea TaxID=171969 RepID=A0A9Q1K4B1_9CARY|nr:hypothetical protein Cgig2_031520 [Carnegiea gigantea]